MRYMGLLLERVQWGDLDPQFVINHELPIDRAHEGYRMSGNRIVSARILSRAA